jgi:hypothetical protein
LANSFLGNYKSKTVCSVGICLSAGSRGCKLDSFENPTIVLIMSVVLYLEQYAKIRSHFLNRKVQNSLYVFLLDTFLFTHKCYFSQFFYGLGDGKTERFH